MQAPSVRRQKTITVCGHKVKIVSSRITNQANLVGWKVAINGFVSKWEVLTRREAIEKAWSLWLLNGEFHKDFE